MQRLSGWMPTAIRGEPSPFDLVLSLAVRELEEDSFLFALCQDHKLRMWSLRVRRSERLLGRQPGWSCQLPLSCSGRGRFQSVTSALERVLILSWFRVAPQEQACLLEADVLEYMPACKGVRRLAGQGHRLRLAFSSTTGLCLCVYLAVPQRGQFTVLQLVATDNRYSLDHISSLFTTQVN